MLTVSGIDTFYGAFHVVQGVSLKVKPGETVFLLGRNGAGKTTILKSIMGVEPPRSGVINFQGRDITGWQPHKVSRVGICLIPEDRQIFTNLSVLENLEMGMLAHKRNLDREASLNRILYYFPRLRDRLKQSGGSLSGGEQQMLTIARGLVSNPSLMLIDEPSEGLMPLMVNEVAGILRRLESEGVSILLVEQNYAMAMSLGNRLRAYILEKGRIRSEGMAAEMIARKDLLEDCFVAEPVNG